MKIAYYVQRKYAKENYKKECFNSRAFAGLLMVGDALSRAGFPVEYASAATVDATTPCLSSKQYGLILHTTPFRAMPATPAACWEMKYEDIRGKIAQRLGANGNSVFHKGNSYFAVESMGTDTLAAVILSNVVWRGTERDTETIRKLCATKRFWSASARQKQATLEKHFNVADLFRKYDPDDLPTRYLRTYISLKCRQPVVRGGCDA